MGANESWMNHWKVSLKLQKDCYKHRYPQELQARESEWIKVGGMSGMEGIIVNVASIRQHEWTVVWKNFTEMKNKSKFYQKGKRNLMKILEPPPPHTHKMIIVNQDLGRNQKRNFIDNVHFVSA